MSKRRPSLSTFRANEHVRLPGQDDAEAAEPERPRLIDKHYRVTPEASRAFNLLAAQQYSGEGPRPGPALIAEALNMLFEKYGMDQVA